MSIKLDVDSKSYREKVGESTTVFKSLCTLYSNAFADFDSLHEHNYSFLHYRQIARTLLN